MNSYIKNGPGGMLFAGPDAVRLFQAVTLKSGLKLLKAGIRPARGWTITRALAMASGYTGNKYKRGQADQAIADLKIWIQTMRAALPVEES